MNYKNKHNIPYTTVRNVPVTVTGLIDIICYVLERRFKNKPTLVIEIADIIDRDKLAELLVDITGDNQYCAEQLESHDVDFVFVDLASLQIEKLSWLINSVESISDATLSFWKDGVLEHIPSGLKLN